MNILEKGECWIDVDGEFKYSITNIIYTLENKTYLATSTIRPISSLKIEDLENPIEIPLSAYCPICPSKLTLAPDSLPQNIYIKRPSLLSFSSNSSSDISRRVLKEVEICEQLKLHPHPNIAQYIGCQVSDGRIIGICWKRYSETLGQRVNPGHRDKRDFSYDPDILPRRNDYLVEIENGLKHLHSLGLVHNDINPSNIMFDENDIAVVIDFDSCRRINEGLEGVGRTFQWYDGTVDKSFPSNDLDALEEIGEFLKLKGTGQFKFE